MKKNKKILFFCVIFADLIRIVYVMKVCEAEIRHFILRIRVRIKGSEQNVIYLCTLISEACIQCIIARNKTLYIYALTDRESLKYRQIFKILTWQMQRKAGTVEKKLFLLFVFRKDIVNLFHCSV